MSIDKPNNLHPPFNSYQQATEYLFHRLPLYWKIGDKAYKPGLENVIALCKLLNNPHQSYKSIHIAGTNGKGSTAHMLASILQAAGYKTALFTSPHLKDFRERIRINGEMITEKAVVDFVNNNYQLFKNIGPSFFEWSMVLAFKYFADSQVDIAIVEAGLGGRLDSTNIIVPELSIITNIGIDHVQLLGDTIESIASEKAGIIKPPIPVIIGEYASETAPIFRQKTQETASAIHFAPIDYAASLLKTNNNYLEFNITKKNQPFLSNLKLDLLGQYQSKNILTVLCAIDELTKQNWKISEENIRNGLVKVKACTGLMGRWQTLSTNPLTICDVGHNAHGIAEVVKQIRTIPYQDLHIVFGMVKEKDISEVLKLLPKEATYYFCSANISRALDAQELKNKALTYNLHGETYATVQAAKTAAQHAAAPDDLIFIGGSTFIVAEAL